MALPKSPGRRRDLLLIACGIDPGDGLGLSLDEADWVAAAAIALVRRIPLPA
jgi:hypothetical protein